MRAACPGARQQSDGIVAVIRLRKQAPERQLQPNVPNTLPETYWQPERSFRTKGCRWIDACRSPCRQVAGDD
jgi:hypothetical protein